MSINYCEEPKLSNVYRSLRKSTNNLPVLLKRLFYPTQKQFTINKCLVANGQDGKGFQLENFWQIFSSSVYSNVSN